MNLIYSEELKIYLRKLIRFLVSSTSVHTKLTNKFILYNVTTKTLVDSRLSSYPATMHGLNR